MAAFKSIVSSSGKIAYERFHFSEAADTGAVILCSGVIGSGKKGAIPEDPAEEFDNAWRGIGAVLEEAGLGYDNIIEYTSFHVGLQEHLGTFMSVRDKYLAEPWPAWTAMYH